MLVTELRLGLNSRMERLSLCFRSTKFIILKMQIKNGYSVALLMMGLIAITFFACEVEPESSTEPIPKIALDSMANFEINEATGLVMDETFPLIIANCTSCHSAKLITQNRATRDGWASMIDWMQASQGLWKFDEQEPQILDYLAKYYGPTETGRRENLVVEEWYEL